MSQSEAEEGNVSIHRVRVRVTHQPAAPIMCVIPHVHVASSGT